MTIGWELTKQSANTMRVKIFFMLRHFDSIYD